MEIKDGSYHNSRPEEFTHQSMNQQNEIDNDDSIPFEIVSKLIEISSEGYLILDEDYNIRFVNRTLGRWLDTPIRRLTNANLFNTPLKRIFSGLEDWLKGADPGQPAAFVCSDFVVQKQVQPLRISRTILVFSGISYILCLFQDISEQFFAEESQKASDELFYALFENAPDAYYLCDTFGTFIDGNRKAQELSGYLKEELVGKSFLRSGLLSMGQIIKAIALLSRNARGEATGPDDFVIARKDGSKVPVEISTRVIEKNGRKMVMSIARDVSDRKKFEHAMNETNRLLEADIKERTASILSINNALRQEITDRERIENRLRESETRLKAIFDLVPCGIMLVDADTHIVKEINRTALEMFDGPADEIVGQECHSFICPATRGNCPVTDLKRSIDREERTLIRRNGDVLTVLKSVAWISLDDKSYLLESFVDITRQTLTEQELRLREEQFWALTQNLPGVIFQSYARDDGRTGMRFVGDQSREILGLDSNPDTFCTDLTARLEPEYRKPFQDSVHTALRDKTPWTFEGRLAKPDTGSIWIRGMSIPSQAIDETLFNGILIDVSQQKQLEAERLAAVEALRKSELKYRMLIDHAGDVIWTMNTDLQITYISPSAVNMYGWTPGEFYLFPLRAYLTADSADLANRTMQAELGRRCQPDQDVDQVLSLELEQRRKDGSTFWTEITVRFIHDDSGQVTGLLGITRDITGRRILQETLIQTEKMMTVAGLAAGMAHEINNPLSIILQSTENTVRRLLEDRPGNRRAALRHGLHFEGIQAYARDQKVDRYLEAIENAGERAARIVTSMLQFSRRSENNWVFSNVNDIIDRALELAGNEYDLMSSYDFRNIIIDKRYGSVPDIPCMETELEQVFLNLIKNAAQAMKSQDFSRTMPRILIQSWTANQSVFIAIEDNGPGLDENTRRRIFEPFYTTKSPGLGTGLGLSVAYYIIVDSHQGNISVESQPGSWTRFTIELPVSLV